MHAYEKQPVFNFVNIYQRYSAKYAKYISHKYYSVYNFERPYWQQYEISNKKLNNYEGYKCIVHSFIHTHNIKKNGNQTFEQIPKG